MRTYQKIPSPFKRHVDGPLRNQFIDGEWASPELEATAGVPWLFTEKFDGTNIRVGWDGHKVAFGGRTDAAQIQPEVQAYLDATFLEELFEQKFGETEVTLYGEATGPKIQKVGRLYGETKFTLFDVNIHGMWLLRDSIEDVAAALGVGVVPIYMKGTIMDAIAHVRTGIISESMADDHLVEGLVGVTQAGLLDRRGERLIVKIKTRDFR
jgi:hypothetical protein